MAERCSCSDQGDAVVFGECRKCMPDSEALCARHNRSGCWSCMKDQPVLHATSEGVAADNLQQELDELERPYERVLGPDELED